MKLDEPPISAAGAGPPPTYLGLTGESLPDGIRVTDVTEASPAEKAGVKVDDLVKTFDDEPITSSQQLAELVRVHRPGDQVALAIDRGGETIRGDRDARRAAADAGGPGGSARRRRWRRRGRRGVAAAAAAAVSSAPTSARFVRDQEGGGRPRGRRGSPRTARRRRPASRKAT